ncbi:hypothetical protein [Streptomyces sp. KL110A]|uniref:hypothetical protein n=1 Tax=Streptomyces sp. KL110A TaxID=3384221 RepID=UPI0038C0C160
MSPMKSQNVSRAVLAAGAGAVLAATALLYLPEFLDRARRRVRRARPSGRRARRTRARRRRCRTWWR